VCALASGRYIDIFVLLIMKVRVVCLPYVLPFCRFSISTVHPTSLFCVRQPSCVRRLPSAPSPSARSSLCPLPFAVLLRTLATAGPPQDSVPTPRWTRHHRRLVGHETLAALAAPGYRIPLPGASARALLQPTLSPRWATAPLRIDGCAT
jgi:hypothetical protein